jgi:hypothetical protein
MNVYNWLFGKTLRAIGRAYLLPATLLVLPGDIDYAYVILGRGQVRLYAADAGVSHREAWGFCHQIAADSGQPNLCDYDLAGMIGEDSLGGGE